MSDFLIIGGGIAGLSTAARLAPLGSVTLLEAEPSLGYHASGRSAAIFLRDYGNDTVRALNYASIAYLEDQDLLTPRSMMLIAGHDKRAAFEAELPSFKMEQISIADAQNKFPILNAKTVGYVGYREDIFDLDADLMLQNFAKAARAHGATLITGARVDAITHDRAGWTVRAGETAHKATTLINAGGAWADQIAAMAGVRPLSIQPYRRSFAQLAAPGGQDMTGWPFVDAVEEAWYAKPSAGKMLVSPSEEDPMDPFDAYADDMVLAEGLARYEEMMTESVTRPEITWAGLRSFAPDRALVLGRDPVAPDFIWCAGQGGYGFQTSPAASQLILNLIAGTNSELDDATIAALSPARFH